MKRRTLFSWLFGGATASIAKEAAPSVVKCDTPNAEVLKWMKERGDGNTLFRGGEPIEIVSHYSQKAKDGGREIILKLGVFVLSFLLSGCLPLNWVRPSSHHPAPIKGASDEQPSYYPGSRECGE